MRVIACLLLWEVVDSGGNQCAAEAKMQPWEQSTIIYPGITEVLELKAEYTQILSLWATSGLPTYSKENNNNENCIRN